MTGFCLTTSPKCAFYRVNLFLLQNVMFLTVNTIDSIKDVMDECHSALGIILLIRACVTLISHIKTNTTFYKYISFCFGFSVLLMVVLFII